MSTNYDTVGMTLTRGAYRRRTRVSKRFRRMSGALVRRAAYRRGARRRSGLRRRNVRTGGMLGIEKKFVDETFNSVIVNTTAGAEVNPAGKGCIGSCSQGDGASQRDGNKIVVTDIMVKGVIGKASIATSAVVPIAGTGVIAVYYDDQPNALEAVSEEIWTGAIVEAPMRHLAYTHRYKILALHRFKLQPTVCGNDAAGTFAIGWQDQYFEINLNNLNIPIMFKAQGAVIADNVKGAIGVIAVQGDGGVVTLQYNSRVRFVG